MGLRTVEAPVNSSPGERLVRTRRPLWMLVVAVATLVPVIGGSVVGAEAAPAATPPMADIDGHSPAPNAPDLLPPQGRAEAPDARADAAPPALPCEGNGKSGKRIQVVYAHKGQGDALTAAKVNEIRANVTTANGYLLGSARQVGARRNFRFVTKSCQLDIADLQSTVPNTDLLFDVTNASTRFSSPDRVYLLFVSSAFVHPDRVAGQTSAYADDTASPQRNVNSSSANVAQIFNWNPKTVAHELGHALGAVQAGAPGATRQGHCWDGGDSWDTGSDIMCTDDGSLPAGQALVNLCSSDAGRPVHYYDCKKDTYFNPNPAPGSYLATHWNIANSLFMTSADVDPARAYPAVDDAFAAILGRRADDAGRLYWASKLLSGTGAERIIIALTATTESQRRNGLPDKNADPAKWVQAIYRNSLCRQPDAAGLSYWTGFARRRGIEFVAATLAGSAEGRRRQAAAPGAGAVICPGT